MPARENQSRGWIAHHRDHLTAPLEHQIDVHGTAIIVRGLPQDFPLLIDINNTKFPHFLS